MEKSTVPVENAAAAQPAGDVMMRECLRSDPPPATKRMNE